MVRKRAPVHGLKSINKNTLSRLLKYIFGYYRIELIIVAVCIVFSSISSVIATMFMQRLIDECILPGIVSGYTSIAIKLAGILTGLAINLGKLTS